jgi:hypothetical protein
MDKYKLLMKETGKPWREMYRGTFVECDRKRDRLVEARCGSGGERFLTTTQNGTVILSDSIWVIKEIK